MSKPTWDTAPAQAQWLAQDEDGQWWWFEVKPKVFSARVKMWINGHNGERFGWCWLAAEGEPPADAAATLEARP